MEHYTAALLSNAESLHFSAICFGNRAAAYQAMGQILDAIADCSLAIALDTSYCKVGERSSSSIKLKFNHALYFCLDSGQKCLYDMVCYKCACLFHQVFWQGMHLFLLTHLVNISLHLKRSDVRCIDLVLFCLSCPKIGR